MCDVQEINRMDRKLREFDITLETKAFGLRYFVCIYRASINVFVNKWLISDKQRILLLIRVHLQNFPY